MAITTYENSPYWDDFADAEGKNYIRVLFQPGRSVQVRELNQLQSNFQDQIAKFGDHIFKDGDRVLNGYTTYDEDIQSIPVTFPNDVQPTASQLASLKGETAFLAGTVDENQLVAKIMGCSKFVGNNNATFYRLYLKYFGTDTANVKDKFEANDVLNLDSAATAVTLGTNTTITPGTALCTVATAAASLENPGYYGGFFQDEGVFFIKGSFVHTDAQSVFYVKETSSSKLSGDCVFNVVEEIVTYNSDPSLLDTAAGTPNQNAPGADRYKISLTLAFVPSGSTSVTENQQRVELLEIVEDGVTLPARTEYSELAKSLATRTEETNGSFIVKPFKLDIREYFNNESGNRGKYTADEIIADTSLNISQAQDAEAYGKQRYVVGVEPSTAYIQGYRVPLEDRQDLVALKGQDANADCKEVSNYQISANFGGYILAGIGNTAISGGDFTLTNSFSFDPTIEYNLFDSGSQVIGFCRVGGITRNPDILAPVSNDTAAGNAQFRVYIYDINITTTGKTLKDATAIQFGGSSGQFALHNSDGFSLEGINDKVYELPYDAVKETGQVTYQVFTKHVAAATRSTANSETITAAVGTFTSNDPSDYILFVKTDAASSQTSSTSHKITSVDVASGGTSATINFTEQDGTDALTSDDICIFAKETVTRAHGKKRLVSLTVAGNNEETQASKDLQPGRVITLGNSDVYQIISVKHSLIGGGSTDIKDDFQFDNGQTPSHYGRGRLKYIGSTPVAAGTITIEYSYFEEVQAGPFTAASYTDNGTYVDSNNNTVAYSGISLQDIPFFQGARLSNAIDFRRDSYNSAGTTSNFEIVPGSVASFDIEYYAPRIDLVSLNQLGDAVITLGVASTEPRRPQLPKDSIELFSIYKPGYVFSLDDLEITENKQRGFKMEDIAELERRVKNVEYYTALTALEKESSEKQIFDGSGQRFKNGIFTDAFTGHGGGDTDNLAYKIGIDREEGICRPMYLSDNSRWSYKQSGSSLQSTATDTTNTWNNLSVPAGTKIHSGKRKGVVCLDFIEKTQITQPFATEHMSVNPYDVATWSGSLELSPSSDEWKDITHRPDIVNNVEGNNDALLKQIAENPNILGTEWNEWQTSWTGWRWGWGWRGRSWNRSRWRRGNRRGWRWNNWWRRRQFRSGIQTTLKTTVTNEVIDDVPVDTSFIPFIRSRKVFFKGQLLKPNTKFYVYFDDVNVTSYCANATFTQFGGDVAGDGGTDVVRYDGKTAAQVGGTGNVTTDASGECSGFIVIPNNDALRFRTGTRQVRLTDNENNNKLLETSSAETSYFARGILETRQRTVLSTRQLSLERTRVSQARNVTRRRWRVWRDPIAQTFMIGNEPTGIFLSSIDLFIQDRDPSIPLELSIVTVENGIPTQDTVPHSKVIKKAADVTLTPDAQTPTNFMFDQPVYLQPGVEYAVVLISNSARWRCWVARVGGTNVVAAGQNAEKVTKNVNLGVLLKSQNASTWTPDQNADLKFTINRADFQEENNLTAQFLGVCPQRKEITYVDIDAANNKGYNSGPPTITFGGNGAGATATASIKKGGVIDRIIITNGGIDYDSDGSTTVTIGAPSPLVVPTTNVTTTGNGYIFFDAIEFEDGQEVTYTSGTPITNMTSGVAYYLKQIRNDAYPNGGIYEVYSDSNLQSIVNLDGSGADDQEFLPTGGATGTALVDTWKGSMFYNLIEEMVLPEAETTYELTLRGDDSSTAGTNEEATFEIIPNDIIYTGERFTHDKDSGINSGTFDNVLKLEATLGTTDSKISPIIDLDRISLLSFDNIIGESAQQEKRGDKGEGLARYISKVVDLENPADGINIYFDAVLPDESCDIKVFLKRRLQFSDVNEQTNMDTASYIEIQPANGKRLEVNPSFEFEEIEYEYQDDDEQFDQFQIKIVFTSTNPAFAPEIKNLRAIATV